MLAHWTQNDLLVNGARLHYYRTGHGEKRPLVLVHGFSDNGLCWSPTARDLEAEYDVVMPDMRAHGLSARVQPGEQVNMGADLAELIRALGLQRPIVCGHSMGAGVTFQIGARFPELASALILEDPMWRLPSQALPAPPGEPGENPVLKWAKSLRDKTVEELEVENRQNHPTWPDELIRAMCDSKKQLDQNFVDSMASRPMMERDKWLSLLGEIPHPMLVFTANPDLGALVTPEAAAKARELKQNITIVHIPDVGHLIRFDRYDVFMAALRAFLKQLPE